MGSSCSEPKEENPAGKDHVKICFIKQVTSENKVLTFFNTTSRYKKAAMNGSTKKPQKKEVFESTETAAEMSPLSHFEVVDKGEQCKT